MTFQALQVVPGCQSVSWVHPDSASDGQEIHLGGGKIMGHLRKKVHGAFLTGKPCGLNLKEKIYVHLR